MSHGHFLRAIREWGIVGTFKQLQKTKTLKFGQLVGTDRYGNQYFENTKDYPFGQHRWVVYAGDKTFYECDASNIPAEWHSWIHHSTDEPPTTRTTGSTHRTPPIANAYGSSAPYARNLGGVITEHTPNLSSYRPRGYGIGNGLTGGSEPHQELYWTQPGYPTDKRNNQVRAERPRPSFTLKDTPLTLAAKEAVRKGINPLPASLSQSRPSPTLQARLGILTGPNGLAAAEVAAVRKVAKTGGEAPDAATVVRTAREIAAIGHSRPWGEALEAGTAAAARAAVVSEEEEAFLLANPDANVIRAKIAQYDSYISSYAIVESEEVQEAVEEARAVKKQAVADLEKLRGIQAKLAALDAEWDAKGMEAAEAIRQASKERVAKFAEQVQQSK